MTVKIQRRQKKNLKVSSSNNFETEWAEEVEAILREEEKSRLSRKVIKRKPGTKPINYFDDSTQDAIIAYQNEKSPVEQNKIYLEKIYPALDSLIENLINVYGFSVTYESRTDLKNECLEFLFRALPKFNAEKGSKAFSYFNVVAKNWLTIKSKQNVKKNQTYLSIDNKDNISEHDLFTIESFNIAPDGEEVMLTQEAKEQVQSLIDEIKSKAKTENEQKCVVAIDKIFKYIEDLDLLNKRAILQYMRDITGLSSKQLSIVLASLKKHYKEIRRRDDYSI